jgi:hypothetical protein
MSWNPANIMKPFRCIRTFHCFGQEPTSNQNIYQSLSAPGKKDDFIFRNLPKSVNEENSSQ